jgi:hypothetical protein
MVVIKVEYILIKFIFFELIILDLRGNSSRHYTPQAYRSNQSQTNATETSDVCIVLMKIKREISGK